MNADIPEIPAPRDLRRKVEFYSRKNEDGTIRRFGWSFRIQHIILFVSFILAVVSGLPLKYPEAALSRFTVALLGGMEMRAHIHHTAGLVMVTLGAGHLFYHVFLDWKHPFFRRPILIRFQDLVHLIQHQKYNLGLRREMPRMGRYTWFEKFDYLGVIWGIGVMGLTGLPMLYMDQALKWIPLSWLQTLWAAHSEEAMLATLFLLVIHMYHVHFSPERFPMSLTWWDGKITGEDMEKYHPLELEEMEKQEEMEKLEEEDEQGPQ